MNLLKKASMFRTKASAALSKAQKLQKAKNIKARKATKSKISDGTSSGVGVYARKSDKGLTRRQAYRLEKKALANEALKINAKPAIAREIGNSIFRNTAAPTGTAAASFGVTAGNKISSLIGGGANKSGTSNEEELEEMASSLPGNYNVR